MAKEVTRKLSIFINDKEVKNSLGAIGREIGLVKKQLKEANDPADIKKYKAELDKLGKAYGDVKNEIHEQNISLEEAQGHYSNLFTGLATGDMKLVQAGIQGITSNIKGMTAAAKAFILSPIGIAIAALSGIALATKKWIDFNNAVFESNKLVKELTNETGTAVDGIRIRAEVLRDTFELDIKESINTAKSLVNNFGISYQEAFDLIEESAVRGKHKNGEFLDSLKEYPVQFKNAGFSAKEFIDIVSTGVDLSIYQDKLPDAIKEFTLVITEQTTAAKEAMTNAFGAQFTNTLFNNIKSGAITPKQALAEIAAEANRIGLNSQQAQQLTADLFKSAGEDAGGALKVFEAVNIALNGQQKPLTENQVLTQKQLELNKELKGVYTQLFASSDSGFQNLIARGKIFATETLLKILKGGVNLYNWFIDLNNQSGFFSAILSSIGKVAAAPFKAIGILINNAAKGFSGLKDVITGVFTFDSEKIKQGFAKQLAATTNLIKDFKDNAVKDVQDIYDAFQGNNQIEKVSLSNFFTEDTSSSSNGNANQDNTVRGAVSSKFSDLIERKKNEAIQEIEINLDKENQLARDTELSEKKKLQIREKYSKAKQRLNQIETNNEKLTIAQRLSHYTNMFSGISTLLGRNTKAGKAAAIAQATMNTYQGVTEVWSTKSTLPEPFATISRIANTAIVLGSGLSSVRSIKNTQAPAFYYGGPTGQNAIGYDGFGKITGYVHDNEWVAPKIMTQNPKYAANLAYLEKERQRLTKGFFNGGFTTNEARTSTETNTPAGGNDFSMLMAMVSKNTQFLELLIKNGVTAIISSDLRNMKKFQKALDDYAALKNKNIR